jgi:hypothetical protein
MTTIEVALRCADRGWPVLPIHTAADRLCSCGRADCASPGKHPHTLHGLTDATTDRATVIRWFERIWRGANLAARTGRVSGFFALDVDEEGHDTLRELERERGPLPRTASVTTPNDGQHYHYRHPGADVPSSAGRIGPGIDIRGEGGYVLLPPSIGANGVPYEVDEDAPLADAPAWMVQLARGVITHRGPAHPSRSADDSDVLRRIPAIEYVPLLLGQVLGGDHKVVCPFHDDHAPSLHAYVEPERGWCCYGCGAGGSIIDFGARLYRIEPRGAGFHEIRRRLAVDLLRGAR